MDEKFRFTALKLCTVFGIVFLLQVFYEFSPGFSSSQSPFWKFFTSILGHSDLQHLLNNVFFIGLFGSIFERLTSGRVFLTTFILSALVANISAFIFFPGSYIIGASGGGMGVMAALTFYRPNQPGLALGIPVPMWAAALLYVMINLAGLTAATNTAYEAHLLGIASGALVGLYLRDAQRDEKTGDEEDSEDFRRRIREWEEKWMM